MLPVLAMLGLLAGCDVLGASAQRSATGTPSGTGAPTPVMTASPSATPSPDLTPLGPLSGTWQGTWTNTAPVAGTGTFTLVWAQQDSHLIGAITIQGSNCVNAGNVTGSAVGTTLRFGAVEGSFTIDYAGIVVDGNTIMGSYRSPDCDNAQGTWQATRNTASRA
ncbi:MAG TPA: hypothetical protein VH561_20270 [Micromonosporaceae bacterium]|jgi:hypothetical protein